MAVMKPANTEVPERYETSAKVWDNLLGFWNNNPPRWAIASNFYHAIRREYSQELLEIIDGGGDAYTRVHKLREFIAENS
jgi:hypothetical protein